MDIRGPKEGWLAIFDARSIVRPVSISHDDIRDKRIASETAKFPGGCLGTHISLLISSR
jgi:hypothetical protein